MILLYHCTIVLLYYCIIYIIHVIHFIIMYYLLLRLLPEGYGAGLEGYMQGVDEPTGCVSNSDSAKSCDLKDKRR